MRYVRYTREQILFDDGDTISLGFPRSKCDLGLSSEEMKQLQIMEQESISKFNTLEPNGFQNWSEYLDTCAAYLDCGLPNFIEERLDISSLPAFLYEALRAREQSVGHCSHIRQCYLHSLQIQR